MKLKPLPFIWGLINGFFIFKIFTASDPIPYCILLVLSVISWIGYEMKYAVLVDERGVPKMDEPPPIKYEYDRMAEKREELRRQLEEASNRVWQSPPPEPLHPRQQKAIDDAKEPVKKDYYPTKEETRELIETMAKMYASHPLRFGRPKAYIITPSARKKLSNREAWEEYFAYNVKFTFPLPEKFTINTFMGIPVYTAIDIPDEIAIKLI